MPEEPNLQSVAQDILGMPQKRLQNQEETLSEKSKTDKAESYKSPLRSLRTYQGDVEEIMSKNKTSMATIVIAEQKRKEAEPISAPNIPRAPDQPIFTPIKNNLFAVGGGLFIILGIIAVGTVVYLAMTKNTISPNLITDNIIAYTEKISFSAASSTRTQLINTILEHKKTFSLPPNSVLNIELQSGNGTLLSIEKVIPLLAPQIPSALARSLENKYMIGIYSFDTNEPFIILKNDDFGPAFTGMIKWEETMVYDLGKIFAIPEAPVGTPYIFEDEALRNKDLRIVKDKNKKTILVYSFIDKNTIVITSHENILMGIVGKYINGQMVK